MTPESPHGSKPLMSSSLDKVISVTGEQSSVTVGIGVTSISSAQVMVTFIAEQSKTGAVSSLIVKEAVLVTKSTGDSLRYLKENSYRGVIVEASAFHFPPYSIIDHETGEVRLFF